MRKGYECKAGGDFQSKKDCLYYDQDVHKGECTAIAGCSYLRKLVRNSPKGEVCDSGKERQPCGENNTTKDKIKPCKYFDCYMYDENDPEGCNCTSYHPDEMEGRCLNYRT